MRIARALYDQMIEHAREEAPNECCGMVAARDGEAVKLYRTTNVEHSPYRFVIDPNEQVRIYNEIEAEGNALAIYHSHTRTEPEPSETDIRFAKEWPGVLWIIVGLERAEADVRLWRIENGSVEPVELVVE